MWIGSGLDGIDGLTAGDPVTAKQMRALFGCGLHPLTELASDRPGLDGTCVGCDDESLSAPSGNRR